MADVKTKASEQEVQEALALLRKTKEQRAKQAAKLKSNPELKAKAAENSKKRRIKDVLLLRKAHAAGITVSDSEVANEIRRLAG